MGTNCPYCSNKKVCSSNSLSHLNPELASELHPTKNDKLSPNDVTPGSGKKIWWKCHNGHEWLTRVQSRSNGSMCPACKKELVNDGY